MRPGRRPPLFLARDNRTSNNRTVTSSILIGHEYIYFAIGAATAVASFTLSFTHCPLWDGSSASPVDIHTVDDAIQNFVSRLYLTARTRDAAVALIVVDVTNAFDLIRSSAFVHFLLLSIYVRLLFFQLIPAQSLSLGWFALYRPYGIVVIVALSQGVTETAASERASKHRQTRTVYRSDRQDDWRRLLGLDMFSH